MCVYVIHHVCVCVCVLDRETEKNESERKRNTLRQNERMKREM